MTVYFQDHTEKDPRQLETNVRNHPELGLINIAFSAL